jgi:hypothetical protein
MKKISIVSALAVSLLLGVTGLQANEAKSAVSDSVAKTEAAALKAGKVKGEDAAKAAVEEAGLKEDFKAKQVRTELKKDSEADKKKTD